MVSLSYIGSNVCVCVCAQHREVEQMLSICETTLSTIVGSWIVDSKQKPMSMTKVRSDWFDCVAKVLYLAVALAQHLFAHTLIHFFLVRFHFFCSFVKFSLRIFFQTKIQLIQFYTSRLAHTHILDASTYINLCVKCLLLLFFIIEK